MSLTVGVDAGVGGRAGVGQRLKDELALALDAVEADDAARVLLITGASRDGKAQAFCAGAGVELIG
jgi:enoyl-CoA hydratase/carnithine racemase